MALWKWKRKQINGLRKEEVRKESHSLTGAEGGVERIDITPC